MQSFLQYRRFGKHVAAQFERDKAKSEGLDQHDLSETTSPSSSNVDASHRTISRHSIHTQDHANIRDPEKGQPPNCFNDTDGFQKESDTAREKDLERNESYEPIRATPSGRDGDVTGEEANHMQKAATARSLGTQLGLTLTGIDVRDRSTKEGGEGQVFVVGFEGEDDIMNPHNWSKVTRFAATYVSHLFYKS